jgi:hypothetical protein
MIARLERTIPGRLLIWCIVTPILSVVMAVFSVVYMTWEYLLCGKPLRELLHL